MPEEQTELIDMIKSHAKLLTLWVVGLLTAAILPMRADVPIKKPLARYAELWTKSPFTVPPPKDVPDVVVENPLDDYTLAGACEMKGGWFVVLINKKERDKRVRIRPGVENDMGFQVIKVDGGQGFMDTKVQIKTRSGKKGTVEYDRKFIVLKKATPRANPSGKPGAKPNPSGRKPPVPGRTSTNRTPPRPGTSTSSGGRPRVRRIPNPPSR